MSGEEQERKQQQPRRSPQPRRRLYEAPSVSPSTVSTRSRNMRLQTRSEDEEYTDYNVVARDVFAVLSEDGAESSRPIEQAISWQNTRSGFDSIYSEQQAETEIETVYHEAPIDWKKSNDTPDTEERVSNSSGENKDGEAEQADRSPEKSAVTRPCRLRYSLIILAAFLILIGGALAIIFVLDVLEVEDVMPARSKDSGPPPGPRTTFPPTPVPTVDIQTTQAQSILSIILEQDVVNPNVFSDPSSPQSKSLNWISTKGNVEQATDEEILSMFAILTLYYSTGGGQTWLSNFPQATNDVCLWWFVECDEGGEATEIRLASAGLHGYLPFMELTFLAETLTVLDVANNDLTGTIAPEIGAFSNLKELHLQENPSMSGSLPTEIGKLGKLEALDLVVVDGLSGTLPSQVGNMASLKSLSLVSVNMDGTIPTDLARLEKLQKLDIQSTKLVGPIPSELGPSMSSLQIVRIAQTPLTGSIPSQLWSMPQLNSLVLEGLTDMTAELDFYIGLATNLQDLRLSLPNLQGELPDELGLLSNLLVLSISSKALQGGIPTEVGDLSKLQSFALTDASEVSGPIPTELAKLSSLHTLIVVNTGISGPVPSILGQQLSNLEFAVFRGNALTGTFPSTFSQLPDLSMVHFGENDIQGSVPQSVCGTVPAGGIIVDCLDIDCGCCACQESLNAETDV